MRCEYLTKDINLMEIVVSTVDLKPFYKLGDIGFVIKMSRYNLEGVILACLEDYGIEKVMEMINSLRTDTEPIYVPEKQSV